MIFPFLFYLTVASFTMAGLLCFYGGVFIVAGRPGPELYVASVPESLEDSNEWKKYIFILSVSFV